jgi:hypothetical protein
MTVAELKEVAANKGIEVALNFDAIRTKNFRWTTSLNLAHNKNEITKLSNDQFSTTRVYAGDAWIRGSSGGTTHVVEEGYPVGQFYGWKCEGIKDGKYILTDMNGDGQISSLDQVPIGYPQTPEIVYGFGVSFGKKNFDFSCFFQGLARESFWIDYNATTPFVKEHQLLKVYADSHWSENNRDIYALHPRFSTTTLENNAQSSTWWMRNGSFLRLKSVEVGYTIRVPKWRDARFRIYVSGTNLLTFSKFKLWDPEMAGNGLGYPIQRVFNVGVNINL